MGKLVKSFLGSKLAARVFLLFLAGAFLPLAAVFALALWQAQNSDSTHLRGDLARWHSVHESILRQRVTETSQWLLSLEPNALEVEAGRVPLPALVTGLMAVPQGAGASVISGDMQHPAALSPESRQSLRAGQTLLVAQDSGTGEVRLTMYRVAGVPGQSAMLAAELDPRKLLPASFDEHTGLCLMAGPLPLHCSADLLEVALSDTVRATVAGESRQVYWSEAGIEQIAHSALVVMANPVTTQDWMLMVSHAHPGFLAYVNDSGLELLVASGLTLLLAGLLSVTLIRRTLMPLRELLEATQQVAHQDFSHRLTIKSKDEVGELSRSFNMMSDRLGQQFKVLKLLSDLDRLILSGTDIDRICAQVLEHLPEVLRFETAAVIICDPTTGRVNRSHFTQYADAKRVQSARHASAPQPAVAPGVTVNAAFVKQRLQDMGLMERFQTPTALKTSYLTIQTEDGLSGMLILGRDPDSTWDRADDVCASDIADRVGVAIAGMQKSQQLFLQTRFDPLTRLPNRVLFSDRLVQDLARAQRSGQMLALLYVDLDFFKQVNDTLGHSAGDQVLRTVATRLRASMRDSDTVARLSGDEFAIILSDITQARDAGMLARNIIARLSAPFDVDNQQCFLCASIGITLFPSDGQEPETLLRNADIAMYRAKEEGKGRYVFYEERMNRETHNLANLDRELRVAVEQNQFVLHFQPQVDLRTGRICGAEALIRWRHPERGLLAPAYFMSHAENSGLVEPLGELVLVKACEQFNHWRMLGIAPERISINASPRQFKRPDFYRFVENTLKGSDIPPSSLEIEITETVLMEETDIPRVTISKLASLGVRIAIDDFGTGYSSLAYLKRLPFHVLKIDRSFVRDVTTDEDARTIASTIIAMAHSLRKDVVAEGVDDPAQLAFLRAEQCDQVQGYLFSPPLEAEAFVKFLREHQVTVPSDSLILDTTQG